MSLLLPVRRKEKYSNIAAIVIKKVATLIA